jgi:hypothetical protein
VVPGLLEDASRIFPILLFSEFSVKVVRHRVRLWKAVEKERWFGASESFDRVWES